MLTYKRKLILTKAQQSRIDSWIGACRVVYNLGLEVRREAWKNKQISVHKYELQKQITELRKDVSWIEDVPSDSLALVTSRLDNAYNKFFKGGGFPKWASKRHFKSIHLKQVKNVIRVENNKVNIPKMGGLKIFNDSAIVGNIRIATIIKESDGYFICITTDATKNIQSKDDSQVIGLDMGIAKFCTDSNGGFIENPRHFKKYERQLRIENRSLARKKKGSNSWTRQCKKLALLHHKIANVRKDFLHKESTKIAKACHTVYMEDLKIKSMVKSNVSKPISDAGWGLFRTMLSYKTNVVAINPKFTSQTCNECGEKDAKSRVSQSEFACTKCGHISNADINAAKNILSKGITFVRQREAKACA